MGDARTRAERLEALRKQLSDAVEGEQYERAARLRDELRRAASLQDEPGVGGGEA
ncbi:MAG: UvrB/UvrC motif-containing protein [Phycisphaerales bacterium]